MNSSEKPLLIVLLFIFISQTFVQILLGFPLNLTNTTIRF